MLNQNELLPSHVHAIANAANAPDRIALLFSGGIESCLLLHLVEPWRHKVTLYTVRTGAEFPHMVEFIGRKMQGWQHRIVQADLAESFHSLGIPASVVPIEHVPDGAAMMNAKERTPRITPWPLCCLRNRWQPGCEAIKADGITAVLHGQRAGDYPKTNVEPLAYPGLELVAPLWETPRADVVRAVQELGIELPWHYGEYPSSLDCSVCPSSLTTPRRAWMAQHAPENLRVAEGLHAAVTGAAMAALNGDNTKNGFRPS